MHLQSLDRRIHVAHRAAGRALLAHDMPGLERLAQFHFRAEASRNRRTWGSGIRSAARTIRLLSGKPAAFCSAMTSARSCSMKYGSMKRSCSSVPQRARRARFIGLAPEARDQRTQHELLREAHALVRRHLEGAHLEQPEAAGVAVGREHLVDAELGAMRVAGGVDQQVAEQAVDEPRRRRLCRVGGSCLNASSSSYSESLRASSMRGACEVGPTNRPLNR